MLRRTSHGDVGETNALFDLAEEVLLLEQIVVVVLDA